MSGKIGLVLSGGGAKGAYEVGVYKALCDMGAEPYIDSIAGTSVGALNSALLESRGAEYAEQLWLNLTITDLLNPDTERLTKLPELPDMNSPDYVGIKPDNVLDSIVLNGMHLFKSLKNDTVNSFVKDGLPFNQERISQLIDENIMFDKIYKKIYIVCTDSTNSLKFFTLNNYSSETQKKIILASSTLPVVYTGTDGIEINGERYFDGGATGSAGNTPISCLYNMGCRKIIVVYLKHTADISNQKAKMPDAEIINIIPSRNLGNFLSGTLNLNSQKVKADISLGYSDTICKMKEISEMVNSL